MIHQFFDEDVAKFTKLYIYILINMYIYSILLPTVAICVYIYIYLPLYGKMAYVQTLMCLYIHFFL